VLGSEAVYAGSFLDQIESHILDRREVGGGVIGADAAFVVTKRSYLSPSDKSTHGNISTAALN
jgi:hypothetical protein